MMLSGKQIIQKKIIDSPDPKSVREASYDLRARVILAKPLDPIRSNASAEKDKPSVISREEYELPPQGMVEVISLERVTMPDNVLGYATVKTQLSDQCVLALGIGLIDPGYDSYISSTLVNFGTQPFHLKKGDIFLRLTFHEYDYSGPTIDKANQACVQRILFLSCQSGRFYFLPAFTFAHRAFAAKLIFFRAAADIVLLPFLGVLAAVLRALDAPRPVIQRLQSIHHSRQIFADGLITAPQLA